MSGLLRLLSGAGESAILIDKRFDLLTDLRPATLGVLKHLTRFVKILDRFPVPRVIMYHSAGNQTVSSVAVGDCSGGTCMAGCHDFFSRQMSVQRDCAKRRRQAPRISE